MVAAAFGTWRLTSSPAPSLAVSRVLLDVAPADHCLQLADALEAAHAQGLEIAERMRERP
jgi:hypothetical protein